jgi:hypothetical protein
MTKNTASVCFFKQLLTLSYKLDDFVIVDIFFHSSKTV